MSMLERALADARPVTANDYELPTAATPDRLAQALADLDTAIADAKTREAHQRRLIAIGEAVEGCRLVQQLAWREVHLPDGHVVCTVAALLERLLAAGDAATSTVEASPAEMRRHSEHHEAWT